MTDWNFDLAAAPKDRPILGWCVNPEHCPDCGPQSLCLFHAHADGLSAVEDGPHVIVWGGGFCDVGEYGVIEAQLPNWWFRLGSEFEQAANPIAWADIKPPATKEA